MPPHSRWRRVVVAMSLVAVIGLLIGGLWGVAGRDTVQQPDVSQTTINQYLQQPGTAPGTTVWKYVTPTQQQRPQLKKTPETAKEKKEVVPKTTTPSPTASKRPEGADEESLTPSPNS